MRKPIIGPEGHEYGMEYTGPRSWIDELADRHLRWHALLHKWLKYWNPEKPAALDLGCASGFRLEQLGQFVESVGVDFADCVEEVARRRGPLQFIKANIRYGNFWTNLLPQKSWFLINVGALTENLRDEEMRTLFDNILNISHRKTRIAITHRHGLQNPYAEYNEHSPAKILQFLRSAGYMITQDNPSNIDPEHAYCIIAWVPGRQGLISDQHSADRKREFSRR